jgi:Protein of unknown function (DUF3551)
MRLVLIGFGAFVAVLAANLSPASAAPRPFCMDEGGDRGGRIRDCSYYTFQQCLDTARGLGGFCYENPQILWDRLRAGGKDPAPRRGARDRRG